MENILQNAVSIKNDTSCKFDTNHGFNSHFSINGDVDGWDVYNDIYLYGSWSKLLFGTSKNKSCFIGRSANVPIIAAESFVYFRLMMTLNTPENAYVDRPTKGKIQWLTSTDSTWDSKKSAEFDLIQSDDWRLYTINLGEYQYWSGDITNIRVYPFVDGYSDIQFIIKYIRISSENTFVCLNTQCDYHEFYEHNCKGAGIFPSVEASEAKTRYTTVSGVSDTLIISSDGYGEERINLGSNDSISGPEMAKKIADKLSRIDVGPFAYAQVDYTEDNKLKITSGDKGLANEESPADFLGEVALYIIALECNKEPSFFVDMGLFYNNPLPNLYIIGGSFEDIMLFLHIHEFSPALKNATDTLLYKDYFTNIIGVRASEKLILNQIKTSDVHAYYEYDCNAYINTSTITNIRVVGGINDSFVGQAIYPPNWFKDNTNNTFLLEDPRRDMFAEKPFSATLNTASLQTHLNYGQNRFLFLSLDSDVAPTITFGACEYKSSLFYSIEAMTDAYFKSIYPYSGFYSQAKIEVTGGTAVEALGFNSSTIVLGVKPSSGYLPNSDRCLRFFEINRLIDTSFDNLAYTHNPHVYSVEAGRRDFYESTNANSVATSNSPDYYASIDGANKLIIDRTNPVSDTGRITKVQCSGSIPSGLTPSVLVFRAFKDGTITKLYERVFGGKEPNTLYSTSDSIYEVSVNLLVSKGDLIGFKNFNLRCAHSRTTQMPNALLYIVPEYLDLNIPFNPGTVFSRGVIGPAYYVHNDVYQDSVKLDIDIGKRLNVGRVELTGKSKDTTFEYNVASCLDVSWECNTYNGTHIHTGTNDNNGTTYYWTHQTIAYGLDSLSDGKRLTTTGKAGEAYGVDTNGVYTTGTHEYFYLNGDAEWLYGNSGISEFSYPYYGVTVSDFEFDPMSLFLIIPENKSVPLHKSIIYFKDSENFKRMGISYYMGPNADPGDVDGLGFKYITKINSVVLDGVTYYNDYNKTNQVTVSDYVLPNPMPLPKLNYVSGEATNWPLYQVAGNTRWNVFEHNFDSVEAYGFKIYCDWHKSTKITEIELYSSFTMTASMVENFSLSSSAYGEFWDEAVFSQNPIDSTKVFTNINTAPRYFKIDITPQTEFSMNKAIFLASNSDLKLLDCSPTIIPEEASKGKLSTITPIDIENTYDRPLNLYVNIPYNKSQANSLLSWIKLSSETDSIFAEIGPGAVVHKSDDYPLVLFDKQVAINCPAYYLKNLTDNKPSFSFEKETYWEPFKTLEADVPVDYFNDPASFKFSMEFTPVSGKYWKIVFHKSGFHDLFAVKVYFENELIPYRNLFLQSSINNNQEIGVPCNINDNNKIVDTFVLKEAFANNSFLDSWDYDIHEGNYFVEDIYGLRPVTVVSGSDSYFTTTFDSKVNSFEFTLDFVFLPFDLDDGIGYVAKLLDNSGIPVVFLTADIVFDEVIIGAYVANIDKLNEPSTFSTDFVLFQKSFNFGVVASFGGQFRIKIVKKYSTITYVSLIDRLNNVVLFENTTRSVEYCASKVSSLMLGYSSNNFTMSSEARSFIIYNNVKSVVFDIADNWAGPGSYVVVRSVDFYDETNTLIDLTDPEFSAFATSYWSSSFSGTYPPSLVFVTSITKTGGGFYYWIANAGQYNNQRLICVFNEPKNIRSVVVNNGLANTNYGMRNYKLYFSSDEITDITYNAPMSNSVLVSSGEMRNHVPQDIEDPILVDLLDTPSSIGTISYSERPFSIGISTTNVEVKALPVISFNEALTIELPHTTAVDKVEFIMNNNDVYKTSVFVTNTLSDPFILWSRNTTRYLGTLMNTQFVHASGWLANYRANPTNTATYNFYPHWALTEDIFYSNAQTLWQDFGQLPLWWVYDCGAGNERKFNSMYLKLDVINCPHTNPDTLKIYGSNDTTLDFSVKSKTLLKEYFLDWATKPIEIFATLDNSVYYRHYCFVFTDSSGSTETFGVGIPLVKLYEDLIAHNAPIITYVNNPPVDYFYYIDEDITKYYDGIAIGPIIDLGQTTVVVGFTLALANVYTYDQLRNYGRIEMSNDTTNGVNGTWFTINYFSNLSAPQSYPGWMDPFYFDTPITTRWFRFAISGGSQTNMDITEINLLLGELQSYTKVSSDYYNHIFAVDLGKSHNLDLIRIYGDSNYKLNSHTTQILFSNSETQEPALVDWNSDITDVRWIGFPMICGDGVTRQIQYLGVYPDTTFALTKNNGYNCEWASLGSSITTYNYSLNIAPSATVISGLQSNLYYFDLDPYKCLQGDSSLDGFNNCWCFTPENPFFELSLSETTLVRKFVIVHSYDDNDEETWVNVAYNIYGKLKESNDYTLLFEITNNNDGFREHILVQSVLLDEILFEIVTFDGPTNPIRIYDEPTDSYIFMKGGFVREFEIWTDDSTSFVNSENHPVIAVDLKRPQIISGHELLADNTLDPTAFGWDNSESFFCYSDSIESDPQKVSFNNSPGNQITYSHPTSVIDQTMKASSLFVDDELYLTVGYYEVTWRSFGAAAKADVGLRFSGPSVKECLSDNISSGWVSQTSSLNINEDGFYRLTIERHADDITRWGVDSIVLKRISNNSKWVLVKRNTATNYSWDNNSSNYGIDYLSKIRVFATGKLSPTEFPWFWSSVISNVTKDSINTKVGSSSLRIEYPTSSGVDRISFIEGDHFGWDQAWSIKDSLNFWLYISDLDNLYIDEGGFGFGSFYGGDPKVFTDSLGATKEITPEEAFYTWDFKDLNLKTGWNNVELKFDENTLTNPLKSNTTNLLDSSLDFKNNNYFTSFGMVFKGKGSPFYMLLDDLKIKRNWYDDVVKSLERGLCLTNNDYAEIPIGGLNLRCGSIEFFTKLYTDTSGQDNFGNANSRTLFTITNSSNDLICLTIKSSGWFEVGFGGTRYGHKKMYADPYVYDLGSVSFNIGDTLHVALVWSNDGIGMSNNDTLRLYINNNLVINSTDTWVVSDAKSAILRLGGASTILSNNNDEEGSAIFNNVRVYDYCKEEFNPDSTSFSLVDKLNSNALVQLSKDGVIFHDLTSNALPLEFTEVQPGNKVTVFTRVDKTKKNLVDSNYGNIEIEWEVIV